MRLGLAIRWLERFGDFLYIVGDMEPSAVNQAVSLSPINRLRRFIPMVAVAIVVLVVAIVGAVAVLRNRPESNNGSGDQLVELTYWGWSADQEVMDTLIEEFEAQNAEIRVTYEKKALDNYHEVLRTRLESGDPGVTPDVFESNNEFINDVFIALAHNNLVSTSETNQRFFPGASNVCVQSGFVICYPLNFDGLVLMYNGDLLASEGKEEIPDQWSDFRDWANALTKKQIVKSGRSETWVISSPGAAIGTGVNVSRSDMLLWLIMMQNGVPINSAGNIKELAGIESVAAAELYVSFYEEHIWDKSFSSDISMFLSGRTPVMFGTVADVETVLASNPSFGMFTVPPPQIAGVKNLAHFKTIAVASSSSHQEAAWKWADYLTSSEVQRKLLAAGEAGETPISLPSRRDLQFEMSRLEGMEGFEAIFLTSYPIFLPEYEASSAATIAAIEAMVLDDKPLKPKMALDELVKGLNLLL